jgi:hypothetical protein
LLPILRTSTGAGVPQSPLRIGVKGTMSAVMGPNDCTHCMSAASISLSAHAAAGGSTGVDCPTGPASKERPQIADSRSFRGANHPGAEGDHKGNVRTGSKAKPQTAMIDTTVDRRDSLV